MPQEKNNQKLQVLNGVMLNAYPDSIGSKLSDTITMLKMPEFKNVFSLFYILPTFFNSDLDRGFSIIDYNLNEELVSKNDLKALDKLNIKLKFDIVLNHLSVASPQFKDLLKHGEKSKYKDFFINWNNFWEGYGLLNDNGVIIPKAELLDKLFMRKVGLPVLKVVFPDNSEQPYWNTFYQSISYNTISESAISAIQGLSEKESKKITDKLNSAISNNEDPSQLHLESNENIKHEIQKVLRKNKRYLGQMDVNANSELVWDFYEETLEKLSDFGCEVLRLDAFAYLHKEIGKSNFFNKPGTWDYLKRINTIAEKYNLKLLPEIHAEYGLGLHDEVANENYHIYDFFLPGLMIHTLETSSNTALINWVKEIIAKDYKTINMLGCHDGIPVLDLKGKEVNGIYHKGLLTDSEIEAVMNTIIDRGGRVKNLYKPSGDKISYYQINATFYSALGEDDRKLLLARAIQLFMPGIPQVWYLDLFAGKNDYKAADKPGSGGHKEINRTNLSLQRINKALKDKVVLNQLELIKLRNTLKAFSGTLSINQCQDHEINLTWNNDNHYAQIIANLKTYDFKVIFNEKGIEQILTF